MPFPESILTRLHPFFPSERGTYRLIRTARKLIPDNRRKRTFPIPPAGYTLDLDLNVYPDCCMAFGLYELATVRLIKYILHPPPRPHHHPHPDADGNFPEHDEHDQHDQHDQPQPRFIDGGANIGYLTLLAAYCNAKVDAFEPHPGNRDRLTKNIARAHPDIQKNITVHPLALSDKSADLQIHLGSDNHGSASLYPDTQTGDVQSVTVTAVTLDQTLPPDPAIKIIKLDIEGAEPFAIDGMKNHLAQEKPPAIIGELNPTSAAAVGLPSHEWITRALKIQPRYTCHTIGASLTKIDPTPENFAALGQVNLLLSTHTE